jgi:crotonobetainyl-CoA:carnitine CoA-transferase CaiB-like acyl-CoA transferase
MPLPIRWAGMRNAPGTRAPALGADTAAVLGKARLEG